MDKVQITQVCDLLSTSETALRNLAVIVAQDPFSFFQGADLTGLSLDDQDLRGMNFAGADLRFSTLNNTDYDPGAFNGSKLDRTQSRLQDLYEFYADDLFQHDNRQILIHCRWRPLLLDSAIAELMINLSRFAEHAGVSSNALRKARAGQVVAIETARSIVRGLRSLVDRGLKPIEPVSAEVLLRQPSFEFLSGGINMPFKHISRVRYQEIQELRTEIKMLRRILHPSSGPDDWRDTPESLDTLLSYYRGRYAELDNAIADSTAATDF